MHSVFKTNAKQIDTARYTWFVPNIDSPLQWRPCGD
jgi:hypothetical protein